jgi:hypothetical protein
MLNNPDVSGGISLETKVIGKIRGIQLTGKAYYCEITTTIPSERCHPREGGDPFPPYRHQSERCHPREGHNEFPSERCHPREGGDLVSSYEPIRNTYLKRFPFALAAKLDLWILYIDYIKMTDNLLGFGKKLIWERP